MRDGNLIRSHSSCRPEISGHITTWSRLFLVLSFIAIRCCAAFNGLNLDDAGKILDALLDQGDLLGFHLSRKDAVQPFTDWIFQSFEYLFPHRKMLSGAGNFVNRIINWVSPSISFVRREFPWIRRKQDVFYFPKAPDERIDRFEVLLFTNADFCLDCLM